MALTQLTKIDGGGISTTSDYRVGVITATKFIGPFEGSTGTFSGNITAVDGTFSGNVTVGGTLTYEDVTNIDSVGILTARAGIFIDDSITHIGDTNTKIRFPGNDTFQVETDGSARLKITDGDLTMLDYAAGDKVGIGTNVLVAKLDVKNNSNIPVIKLNDSHYNKYLTIRGGGSPNRMVIDSYEGGGGGADIDFASNGSTKVRIKSDGKVGIGTDNPGFLLDVYKSSNDATIRTRTTTAGAWYWADSASTGYYGIRLASSGTEKWFVGSYASHNFQIKDGSASGGTERFTIVDGTGNIGINETSPDRDLHISNTTPYIRVESTSANQPATLELYHTRGNGSDKWPVSVATDDAALTFNVASAANGTPAEKVRITSAGQALVGTTSNRAINSHAPRLQVSGTDYSTSTVSLVNNAADATGAYLFFTKQRSGSAGGSTAVAQDDIIGDIRFTAGDGTDVETGAARITVVAESNAGSNSVPSYMRFSTTSTTTPVERLRITSDGHVIIAESLAVNRPRIVLSAPDDGTNFRHLFGANLQVNSSGTFTTPTANISGGGWEYLSANSINQHGSIRYLSAPDTNATSSTPLERLKIDSSGHITPGAAGTQDLGSTSKEFRNLYLGDQGKVYFGLGQDMTMEFDSSNANISLNAGSLSIINYANNEDVKILSDNGSGGVANYIIADGGSGEVLLHHYGSQKLATSTTGISVTGEVATTQDYPNQRPSVDFNFVSVKKLDPRFTYRCTGPASYTDEFGKVVLVGDNTPRFDHDPTTRESKGLLIEETRTNYIRESLTLATDWSAGGGSYAYDAAITNPDGSVGAYYHTGAELYHSNIDLSGASTNVAIISMWVKARSGQTGVMDIQLYQQISGTVVDMGAFAVNPVTGTVTTNGARWSDGKVTEYPNGWYRFSAKATTASGNFTSSTRLDLQNNEHYVWGMQVEVGSFVTSFIPTNGATSTRGQGFAVIDGEELSDFYNPNASTVICQFDTSNWMNYNLQRYERVFTFGNLNNEDEAVEMFKSNTSATELRWRIRSGGSNVLGASNTTYSPNPTPKFGFAWQLNDAGVCVDGGTVSGTADSGIPIPSITQLSLGNSCIENNAGGHGLTGWIRRFIYYPIKVSDAQLVTLTS